MSRILRMAFGIGLLWGLLPVVLGRHWLGLDLLRMDMGGMCEWRNLLFSGQSLWIAPHVGLGAPFAADPLQGVFYPLKWLYFWLPGFLATDAHVVLHFAVACSGAAWLGRSFFLSRRNALLFAVAYLFSGTLIDLAKHSPYLIGGAWLPWVWGFARAGLRRSTRVRWAGVSVGIGFMLLGGDAFTAIWAFGVALLEGLLVWVRHPRTRFWSAFQLKVAVLVGGALGLIVWWPAWRELAFSGRQEGLEVASALRWSWSLWDFPGVVLAGIFQKGSLLGGSLWNLLHAGSSGNPWNESPYLGFFGILGISGAFGYVFLHSRARLRWGGLAVVFGVSLLLALGSNVPGATWLYESFPFLTNFRYPAKHWVMINLSGLLLASLWLTRPGALSRRWLFVPVAGWFLVFGLALVFQGQGQSWVEVLAQRRGWSLGPQSPTWLGVLAWGLLPGGLVLGLAILAMRLSMSRLLGGVLWVELLISAPFAVEWLSREESRIDLFSPLLEVSEQYQKREGQPPVFCVSRGVEDLGLTQSSESQAEDLSSLIVFQRLVGLPQVSACDHLVSAQPYSIIQHRLQRMLDQNLGVLRSGPRGLGCTHWVRRDIEHFRGFDSRQSLELLAGIWVDEIPDPIPPFFVSVPTQELQNFKTYLAFTEGERSSAELLSWIRFAELPTDGREPFMGPIRPNPLTAVGERVSSTHLRIELRDLPLSPIGGPWMVGARMVYASGWRAFQAGRRLKTVAAGGIFLAALVLDPTAGPVEFRYGFGLE